MLFGFSGFNEFRNKARQAFADAFDFQKRSGFYEFADVLGQTFDNPRRIMIGPDPKRICAFDFKNFGGFFQNFRDGFVVHKFKYTTKFKKPVLYFPFFMNHMNTLITSPEIEHYVENLYPLEDPVLKEMEETGNQTNFPLVGPLVGRLLYQLTKITGAKNIFEMGSGFGYSAFW